MSSLRDATALSAANSIGSDNSFNSSLMRTPVGTAGATVFLREEGCPTFVPVYHQSSVTLRDLAEEFSISSVLECDAQGNVQPRAVAFDSPSDILHSGRHYIARRDARAETGSSYVTFKGKIFVKEYELEHPTPPATSVGKSLAFTDESASRGASDDVHRRKPVATPYADKRRCIQEELEVHEAHFTAEASNDGTPPPQRFDSEDEEATISRALALVSDRKRPRENSSPFLGAAPPPVSPRKSSSSAKGTASDGLEYVREAGMMAVQSSPKKNESVLHDRTNSSFSSPNPSPKVQHAAPVGVPLADESASLQEPSSAPLLPKQPLRFIPFSETAADGTETYVTLETLQQLCSEASTQEEKFREKHRAATDILESARRVLFLNDGSE